MTHPSDHRPVHDFILPICNLKIDTSGRVNFTGSHLAGTAFLIGSRGFGISAAHVVDQTCGDFRYALTHVMIDGKNRWAAIKILEVEQHSTEDVALLKFDEFPDGQRHSYLTVSDSKEFASLEYEMWSYPEVIAKEVKYHDAPEGSFRPDLVFFRGYIRRRMSFSPNPSFDLYRGSIFYEISEIAGSCSSGAPIINARKKPVWDVFAIYIGEETEGRKCGYAVSLEEISAWKPKLLNGMSIKDEALNSASMR